MAVEPLPSRPTVLLLDCDNTLTLTEENAFAATTETINTLLKDFQILSSSNSSNGRNPNGRTRLTASALLALDSGSPLPPSTTQDTTLTTTTTTTDPNDDDSDDSDSLADDTEPKYQTYSAPALLASYIGLPFRQILTSICSLHNISLTPIQLKHYISLEETNVNRQISLFSPPAQDILSTLNSIRSSGGNNNNNNNLFTKLAVVSSSPLARMKSALTKASLYPTIFTDTDLFSASDSLGEKGKHKPHPAIYLHACKVLGVQAEDCLAVEDSVSGTLSAVRAGVRVWGYVGAYHDPYKKITMGKVLEQNGAERVFGEWSEFVGMVEGVESR